MATFSPRELAGVLVALGHLGYTPGPEWFAQVHVLGCDVMTVGCGLQGVPAAAAAAVLGGIMDPMTYVQD